MATLSSTGCGCNWRRDEELRVSVQTSPAGLQCVGEERGHRPRLQNYAGFHRQHIAGRVLDESHR